MFAAFKRHVYTKAVLSLSVCARFSKGAAGINELTELQPSAGAVRLALARVHMARHIFIPRLDRGPRAPL